MRWLERMVRKGNKTSAEKSRVNFDSSGLKITWTKMIGRALYKLDLRGRAAGKKLRIRAISRSET